MPTHRETILPLRALQAVKRAFPAVRDDLTIADIALSRAQLLDRIVPLADDGGWPADPRQGQTGDAA